MRRQAIRTSSAHNVCVFCACRLAGEARPPAAPHASAYVQRRSLQSSRSASHTWGGFAQQANSDSTWRSAEDRDKEALRQSFNAAPAQPQPSASQPAAPGGNGTSVQNASRERQALMSNFGAAAESAPPPARDGPKISYGRGPEDRKAFMNRGIYPVGKRKQNFERSPGIYRVKLNTSQDTPRNDPGFDPNKASQWKHLKPRREQQESQDGNRRQVRHRPAANRDFVALNPDAAQRADGQDAVLRRFNIRKTGEPSQDAASATQPQTTSQPTFAAPAGSTFQDSRVNAERQALMTQFSPVPPASPATRRIFRFTPVGPESQPSETPASSESAPVEEVQGTEEAQEFQFEPEITQNQVPEKLTRAVRRSKLALSNEESVEEAPRKRKGKGGRGKSSEYDEEVDFTRMERKAKKKDKKKQRAIEVAPPTPIYLPEWLSVANLANMLKVRAEDLVRKMEELGYEDINNDDILNAENAGLIAMEYNFEPVAADPEHDVDLYPAPEPEDKTVLPARPPVVTIMGHVDHGKTTLLDYLRKSSVAATEFGGITQHIGAFSVPLSSGKNITFLDTPGHAAFLNMRQRGANVTDIVILVVAADDSVKPQTIEAVKHAKAAHVPMIVAINKIDKEGANPERVKQDLARHGVDVEDFGGDVQAIPVSGKTGQGMKDLEEAAITLSEILDHRADPASPVEGWILEASTKKSGKVATILVRRGTLRPGTIIVAGKTFARVRTMRNEAGVEISELGPGMPAEIDGWRGQPEAGDEVLEAPDEQRANDVVEYREAKLEREQLAKDMEAINEARRLEHEKRQREEAIAAAVEAGEENPEAAVAAAGADAAGASGVQEVPFIVKADVSGSVEAVVDYVMTVGNGEVRPKVIRSGVGGVSEFDIEYAATAGGHIVSFNVALDPRLARVAEARGVRVLEQNVIYRLVDDVKGVLSERLPPLVVQRVTGEASVLQVFPISLGRKVVMNIAGCRVQNGMVTRGSRVRVLRGEEKVYEGTISSLKQVKKDVTEMRKGSECGMAFEGWGDFQAGDAIQCYEERTEKRTL